MCTIAWAIQVQPSLGWKTRPKFCPVGLSLSMLSHYSKIYSRILDFMKFKKFWNSGSNGKRQSSQHHSYLQSTHPHKFSPMNVMCESNGKIIVMKK